jgi:hypothetical protein
MTLSINGKAPLVIFPGEIMTFWQWLTAISQSAAPAGEPFAPHWPYVALAVAAPPAIGLILALILKGIENIFGIRLGGGDV